MRDLIATFGHLSPMPDMLLILGIALSLGLVCGWFIRYYTVADRLAQDIFEMDHESQRFKDFAQEMRESDELLQASQAEADLDLLKRLDAGDISNAKTLLRHSLGLFYHDWRVRSEQSRVSVCIEEQLERIKESAKHFESVKAVLTYEPPNENVTGDRDL